MLDRPTSSRRRLWTTLAAAGALFLVVTILLGVQMALGRDPSMGDRTANRPSPGAQRQALARPQRPVPDQAPEGYGDEYGGQGYGDGYGDQGYGDGSGAGVPEQQVPQQQVPQQQGPPLQSGTS